EELKKEEETCIPRQVPMPDLSNERIFPANIRVKALFEPDAKWRLVEEFGPHCFKEQKDGRLLFEMDYTDEDSLIGWLMTFGEGVEVLEPAALRERILKTAENLGCMHQRGEATEANGKE